MLPGRHPSPCIHLGSYYHIPRLLYLHSCFFISAYIYIYMYFSYDYILTYSYFTILIYSYTIMFVYYLFTMHE